MKVRVIDGKEEWLPKELRATSLREFEVIKIGWMNERYLLKMSEGVGHTIDSPNGEYAWWVPSQSCQVLDSETVPPSEYK